MKLEPVMRWLTADRPALAVVRTGITTELLGVAVARDDAGLAAAIDAARRELCRRGELTALTLEFVTRDGESFRLAPGDVLLAEDTTGGGHRWRLVDGHPWTRVYVRLPTD